MISYTELGCLKIISNLRILIYYDIPNYKFISKIIFYNERN